MYESPIRLLVQQLETSIREQQEKQIFEAIQKCGVDVDRYELIKALAYDRDQYDKGYADGRADAQRWISVEERLPESEQTVMGYTDRYGGQCEMVYYSGRVMAWCKNGGLLIPNVTHWMPLPKPPKEE